MTLIPHTGMKTRIIVGEFSVRLILKSPVFDSEVMEFVPSQLPVVLGRGSDVDVTIKDKQLSRRHAEIRFTPGSGFEIYDLDSTNLTIVNERDVASRVLATGDRILLGDTEILVEVVLPETSLNDQTTRDLDIVSPDADSTIG